MIALCVALIPAPARAGHYGEQELLYRFADARIVESSGCVTHSSNPDVLFTHNDSGATELAVDNQLFAVGPNGATLATYDLVPPARAAVDWEDIARGPGSNGKPALFLADIGDNAPSTRPFVLVYEVPEPATFGNATVEPLTHVLVYEDGPHDAETFLVDPRDGTFAIVTKVNSGRSGVYVAQQPLSSGVRIMRRVATLDFRLLASVGVGGFIWTTGGDIAPDRSQVVVRTYEEAFEWPVGDAPLEEVFTTPPERFPLIDLGEAICYSTDGRALITTAEGARAPVYRLAVQ